MEVTQVLPDANGIKLQPAVNKPHVPAWIVILLLLITATTPVGLYFMFREKCYHSWFPILLWICAGLCLLVLAPFGIFVLPQLSTLYSNFGLSGISSYVAYALAVLLVIGQIAYGIILKRKLANNADLSTKLLWLATIILIVSWYGTLFSLFVSTQEIYKIMSSVQ